MSLSLRRSGIIVGLLLIGAALWLRWPTFGFSLWNLDEAIHAAAARTILDGGVLYRDAADIRNPLSYYAMAAVFAVCGENNLWAVRALVALLVAGTGWMLLLAGRAMGRTVAGAAAAGLYVLLATGALYQGDANAANTEWFVAFFSSAAAAVFLRGGPDPGRARLFAAGLLAGCSFLSKQPALLEVAAPAAALLYAAWQQARPARGWLAQLAAGAAGWWFPVVLTAGYFIAQGAWRDAVFYTWTYNLAYYGPEIATSERLVSLTGSFQLLGRAQPWLMALWGAGALGLLHRLAQRSPAAAERDTNPGLVYLVAWSLAALGGAGASGRTFDHYTIQFLAPFCLGAGLLLARLADHAGAAARPLFVRLGSAALLLVCVYGAGASALAGRLRTLPEDSSLRVSAYIREHSTPDDRIFVWGYHPDIYLYADRRPASRYHIGAFLTGMIPWTNVAPDRDTTYAIVPGTRDTLLRELTARPPLFIVDCSAGPNRHWQKYPLGSFPALQAFVHEHYRLVEPHQFGPQGFRLYQLRVPGDAAPDPAAPPLPAETVAALQLGTLGSPFTPVFASARHGASASTVDGRMEFFAHAPSTLVYRLPPETAALRGSFGLYDGAFAPDNGSPSDGAEFVIRWRPTGGPEQVLLRRLLRPRDEPADRGRHAFRVELPPHPGGELELTIGPGPADNPASDWSYWSDLLLENYR